VGSVNKSAVFVTAESSVNFDRGSTAAGAQLRAARRAQTRTGSDPGCGETPPATIRARASAVRSTPLLQSTSPRAFQLCMRASGMFPFLNKESMCVAPGRAARRSATACDGGELSESQQQEAV
jgi:hypothetical protein